MYSNMLDELAPVPFDVCEKKKKTARHMCLCCVFSSVHKKRERDATQKIKWNKIYGL